MSDQQGIWMSESLIRRLKALVPRRIAGRRWECRSGRHQSHRARDRAGRCDRVTVIEMPPGGAMIFGGTRFVALGFEED